MAILITGASGLVGAHLTEFVSSQEPNEEIVALYHKHRPKGSYANVEFVQCDLLDWVSLEEVFQRGIHQVYHCAAIVSFDPSDGQSIIESNRLATAHVVDASLMYRIQRLIHVSSVAAIGRERANEVVHEQMHWKDSKYVSNYSRSKYAAEMEVWRGFAEGLNGAIVNPGIVLGEGFWSQSSGKLMSTVAEGLRWYTLGRTSFVDVKDLAKAMHLLMHSDVNQERYIISAGNFTYREVFAEMAQQLGVRGPYKYASPGMSELLWRLFYLKSKLFGGKPLITRETAHTAHAVYQFSNEKFLKEFPSFSYTPLKQTIARMSEAYREYIQTV